MGRTVCELIHFRMCIPKGKGSRTLLEYENVYVLLHFGIWLMPDILCDGTCQFSMACIRKKQFFGKVFYFLKYHKQPMIAI